MLTIDRTSFIYTPLFCEENIWKFLKSIQKNHQITPIDVLFITNNRHSIALFNQNNSIANNPVIWDYHVVLSSKCKGELYIFDFDTRSHFPTKINEYFNKTFPCRNKIPDQYYPYIKCIDPQYYLNHFTSDRAHMRNIVPESEFPAYDFIQAEPDLTQLSLYECCNMNQSGEHKQIFEAAEYLKHISKR